MFKKVTIYLSILLFLTSCSSLKTHDEPSTFDLIGFEEVVHLTGITADGKPIVLNALTGKKAAPCKRIGPKIKEHNTSAYTDEGCPATFVDPDPELQRLIDSTTKEYRATIMKDGIPREAIVNVIVSARFEGSICQTTYVAGIGYVDCGTLTFLCRTHESTARSPGGLPAPYQEAWLKHCPPLLGG